MKMSLEAWAREWGRVRGGRGLEALSQRWGLQRHDLLDAAPQAWVTPVDSVWFEALLLQAQQRGVPVRLERCHHVRASASAEMRLSLCGPLDRVVTDVAGLILCAGARSVGLAQVALNRVYWLRLPRASGLVQCIEGYDPQGSLMWRLSGEEGLAGPERCEWRQVLAQMADELGEGRAMGASGVHTAASRRPIWSSWSAGVAASLNTTGDDHV